MLPCLLTTYFLKADENLGASRGRNELAFHAPRACAPIRRKGAPVWRIPWLDAG